MDKCGIAEHQQAACLIKKNISNFKVPPLRHHRPNFLQDHLPLYLQRHLLRDLLV